MRKILGGAVVFVILYNVLFYRTQPGIGTGLLFLAINIYFFFVRNREGKNLVLAIGASALSILFALLFSFRDSEINQILDLAAGTFFSLAAFYFYKQPQKFLYKIFSFLLLPLFVARDVFLSAISYAGRDWASKSVNSGIIKSLIRGIVIVIPVFILLLLLLTQADPVFAKVTRDFFENLGERALVSLIIFAVLAVLGLTRIAGQIIDRTEAKKISEGKAHELGIITGSIITLFAVFIVIQFRYLFSNAPERELHQLGIASLTYSEYVRRGFFELLIASSIASGVVVYVLSFLHYLKDRQKIIIQIFSSILTIETGLLLLSAAKRVMLYAGAHGLTRARVFGFIFLLWLALLLVVFLVRVIKEMRREQFFAVIFIATLAALTSINIVNVDGIIAMNYRPTVNGEIDYYYLSNLSTDAYESWKPAIKDAEKTIAHLEPITNISTENNRKLSWTRLTLDRLHSNVEYLVDKYGTVNQILVWHKDDQGGWVQKLRDTKNEGSLPEFLKDIRKWQSRNLSEYFVYNDMVKDMSYFEQISPLLNRINKIQQRVSNEVRQSTPQDRSTQLPLIR